MSDIAYELETILRIVPPSPPLSELKRRARRRRQLRTTGRSLAAVIVSLAIAAGVVWSRTDSHPPRAPITPAARTTVPVPKPDVVTTVRLGTPQPDDGALPFDIAYGDGSVWVRRDSVVEQREPSGRLLATFAVPGEGDAHSLLFTDGALWIATGVQLVRLDPHSRRLTALPIAANSLTLLRNTIWAGVGSGYVVVDPHTNHVTKRVALLAHVDATSDALWTVDLATGLLRLDPRTLKETETHINASGVLTTTSSTIWLLSGYATIIRVDAAHATPIGIALQAQGVVRVAEPTGEILLVGALTNAGATITAYDIRTHRQLARTSPLPDQGWTRIIVTPKTVWVLGDQRLYRIAITITTRR